MSVRPAARLLLVSAALLPLVAWQDQEPAVPPAPEADQLEITFLANEGFLVRSPDGNLLLDAFVQMAYAGYPALPGPVHQKLVKGEPPFERIDLALVSHVHGDHFQPGSAAAFLLQHEDTRLITSPQVIDDLTRLHPAVRSERLEPVLPDAGEVVTREHEGILVEFLRLPHSGSANRDIQNLGHRIVVDGWTLLHLGDAETSPEVFESYELDEDRVDVVFVPYWYFLERSGRRFVERFLKADTQVAVHLPIEGAAELRVELREAMPGLVVFDAPMQRRVLER